MWILISALCSAKAMNKGAQSKHPLSFPVWKSERTAVGRERIIFQGTRMSSDHIIQQQHSGYLIFLNTSPMSGEFTQKKWSFSYLTSLSTAASETRL